MSSHLIVFFSSSILPLSVLSRGKDREPDLSNSINCKTRSSAYLQMDDKREDNAGYDSVTSSKTLLPSLLHPALYLPVIGPPILLMPSLPPDHSILNASLRQDFGPSTPLQLGTSLVRTAYSAINPFDLKHRRFGCHSTVPGYDFSGAIVATTPGSPFAVGERVCGSAPAGVSRAMEKGAHQAWVVGVNDMLFLLELIRPEAPLLDMGVAAGLGIPVRAAAVALYASLDVPLPWNTHETASALSEAGRARWPSGILIWGGGSQVGAWAVQLAAASKVAPLYVVAAEKNHEMLFAMGATRCIRLWRE